MAQVALPGAPTSRQPFLNRYAVEASYLDLDQLVSKDVSIDLLKCDIEGSELELLENYPDLMRRARNLLIELHPLRCDRARCETLLKEYGFRCERTIHDSPHFVLRFYRRG